MTQELNLGLWVVGLGRPRGVTQELNLGRWVGRGRAQSIRSHGRACFDWAAGGEERVLRNSLRGANGITLAWFEPEGQCEVDVLCDR